ncbi:MAG: hypothetical protein K8S98_00905 [Planctomycetes bacterium]|nr:hypothetical protein [Planctomycetota bacterium]
MSKETPDHHDAEIVMKLYDLRREPVMRASRNAIAQWMPKNWEDFIAVTQPQHHDNAAWRQVSSYFEMAFGFARHGVVNADFLAENTGEGMLLFAKVAPHLERFRKETAPTAFRNAEWMVANSGEAKKRFEMFRTRFAKMFEAK